MKVTTMNGELLYAVRGGKLFTINSDHAKLVKSKKNEVISREVLENNIKKENKTTEDAAKKIDMITRVK